MILTELDDIGTPVTLQTINNRGLSSILTAHIDENGRLVLSGHDIGPRVASAFGDDEYEYWLVVGAEHLDAFATALGEALARDGERSLPESSLIQLLEQAYRQQLFKGVSDLSQWLAARSIPSDFASYS